jgi:hypothetical protein
MMESGPNLPSSSPILTLVLMIVMAAMLITSAKWFLVDVPPDNKELDSEAKKLVGRWEQRVNDRTIDMDLEEDGVCRYALRDSDRLNILGTWKLDEGRLVLHIDKVNAGSTFRVGDDVTLGPILDIESRTLALGTEQDKAIFLRRH